MYGRLPNREFRHSTPDHGSYDDRLWAYVARDITRLQSIQKKAASFIEKAQDRQRSNQNKKATVIKLHIGDQVLLYRNIVESSWSAKLEPKWERPYYIQDIKEQVSGLGTKTDLFYQPQFITANSRNTPRNDTPEALRMGSHDIH